MAAGVRLRRPYNQVQQTSLALIRSMIAMVGLLLWTQVQVHGARFERSRNLAGFVSQHWQQDFRVIKVRPENPLKRNEVSRVEEFRKSKSKLISFSLNTKRRALVLYSKKGNDNDNNDEEHEEAMESTLQESQAQIQAEKLQGLLNGEDLLTVESVLEEADQGDIRAALAMTENAESSTTDRQVTIESSSEEEAVITDAQVTQLKLDTAPDQKQQKNPPPPSPVEEETTVIIVKKKKKKRKRSSPYPRFAYDGFVSPNNKRKKSKRGLKNSQASSWWRDTTTTTTAQDADVVTGNINGSNKKTKKSIASTSASTSTSTSKTTTPITSTAKHPTKKHNKKRKIKMTYTGATPPPLPPFTFPLTQRDIFETLDEQSLTTSRLLENRAYARREPFAAEALLRPVTIEDLKPPQFHPEKGIVERLWISLPFRVVVAIVGYLTFPLLSDLLSAMTNDEDFPSELARMASTFTPGISIVYGTFVSLTISILYNRQSKVQEQASLEAGLLTVLTRDILLLFHNEQDKAVKGCQCVADQVSRMVYGSRGAELMGIMYSDPYAMIVELAAQEEMELGKKGKSKEIIGTIRDICIDAIKVRSQRLSFESAALPPTHFVGLASLSILSLIGFTLTTLAATAEKPLLLDGAALFSILFSVYVLFFNFALDLNTCFDGVYQIRRSSIACHLLQIRVLLCNHPLTKGLVDFDEGGVVAPEEEEEEEEGDLREGGGGWLSTTAAIWGEKEAEKEELPRVEEGEVLREDVFNEEELKNGEKDLVCEGDECAVQTPGLGTKVWRRNDIYPYN